MVASLVLGGGTRRIVNAILQLPAIPLYVPSGGSSRLERAKFEERPEQSTHKARGA